MALFKIYQGDSSRLPNEKHDGWVYVTLDKPAMYVDLIKRNADGSEVAGAALERIKLYDYIKSDIAEGEKNKIAWYNDKGSIISSTNIITNGTNLAIGEKDITKVSTTFYVNGTSRFNGSVQFANGTTYYIDNSGKAVFNTLGVGNITSADITSTNIQPKESEAYNLGSSTSRWKAVYIGTKDTYGSSTSPIYWNGGVPTACSYSLNASINSGTTNQLAWYNSSNSITTGTKLTTNGTNLGIGTTAVGDIGSNALYVNGTSKFVGTTTHTDYIYRSYSASNQSPMIWMNCGEYDNYLWQISDGTTTKQSYGYGLKYIGTGSGVGNYLRLIADNQNNTDITAIGINQNGQVGIGADANTSYRLYVNGNSYFNGNTTHNGIDYFANGTTYYINNNADFILNNGKVSKLGINANVSDTYILNANGSSYFGGNSYNQNIIPIVDNTYTLGESTSSSNKRWKAVYIGTANSYGANSDTLAIPIYWNNGVPAPLSVTRGGIAQPVYLKNGSITACSDDKGSTTKPVYMNAGTITECSYELKAQINSGTANQLAWYNSSTSITTGTKLVTNGTNLGIGTTAINDVGSNALYVNGASKFNGNVTATKFIGPLQGNADTATALTSNAGSSSTPVYFSGGKPVACGSTLDVSITGSASNATDASNATNADKLDGYHASSFVLKTGDTMTGALKINSSTASTSTTTGALVVTGGIGAGGNIYAAKVYNAVWNDYAECFPRGEETEPGDIIALDLDSNEEIYVKAIKDINKAIGVHSDSYGHLIGMDDEDTEEDIQRKFITIGLCGRVMVKVLDNPKKGDYIGPSSIPGVGEVCDNKYEAVGICVDANKINGKVKIKIL